MARDALPGPTDPRELYEHLEVLHRAVDGTSAEASLDLLVDALLRHTVFHSPHIMQECNSVATTISRWQRLYRPTDAEVDQRVAEDFLRWYDALPVGDRRSHCLRTQPHPAHNHDIAHAGGVYPKASCVGVPGSPREV